MKRMKSLWQGQYFFILSMALFIMINISLWHTLQYVLGQWLQQEQQQLKAYQFEYQQGLNRLQGLPPKQQLLHQLKKMQLTHKKIARLNRMALLNHQVMKLGLTLVKLDQQGQSKSLDFHLTVQGSYFNLLQLIKQLTQSSSPLSISKLLLEPDAVGHLNLKLTLQEDSHETRS